MTSAKSAGQTVGILLLAHTAAGLIVPFVLLDRVRGSAGLLANAAGSAGQVRAAVLLLFVGSAMAIAITIAAMPVFRRYSSAMALWLLALGVAAFSLQAVDNAAILTMLSLSQEYATAGAAKTELIEALALVAGSARRWAHYSALLMVGSWIFLLYALLYRFRLVPRALAGFGLIASLGQIAGVTLRGLLGYSPMTVLAMPLAPAYVALAVWLMVKGFDERHGPLQGEAWKEP
ncbi:MAG: DUF4386 domain-containing protein [Candidatus Acidiferrales bacterium]